MSLGDAFLKMRVGRSVREDIYSTLADMLDAGTLLRLALQKLYAIYSDDGRRPSAGPAVMLYEVKEAVRNGGSFAAAIAPWVSVEEAALIAAGEQSGDLRKAFDDALFTLEQASSIRGAIFGGLAYPIMLVLTLVAMLLVISYFVMPSFTNVLPPEHWTGPARGLYLLTYAVRDYGIYIAAAIVTAVWLIVRSLSRTTGNVRYYLDNIPPWTLYRRTSGAVVVLNLSVLLSAGVKLRDSLEILQKSASPYVRERLAAIANSVRLGKSLGLALKETELNWPTKRMVQLLTALDSTNNIAYALRRMATGEIKRTVKDVKRFMSMFFALMLLLVAAVLAFVVVANISINAQINAMT